MAPQRRRVTRDLDRADGDAGSDAGMKNPQQKPIANLGTCQGKGLDWLWVCLGMGAGYGYACRLPIQTHGIHNDGAGAFGARPIVLEAAEGRLHMSGW